MQMKILHSGIALAFPAISFNPYWYSLVQQQSWWYGDRTNMWYEDSSHYLIQDSLVHVNYSAFLRFWFGSAILIAIFWNEYLSSKWSDPQMQQQINQMNYPEKNIELEPQPIKDSSKKMYSKISRYFLWIIFIYATLDLWSYVRDFLVILGHLIGVGVLIGFIAAFYKKITSSGFIDIIYQLMFLPVLVYVGHLILTRELSILAVVKFSPLNMFFVIFNLAEASKSWKKNFQDMTDTQLKNFTIFELLGKHDSFKVVVGIIFYIYIYCIIDGIKRRTFLPIVPITLCSPYFYQICNNFKTEQYQIVNQDALRCYLLFAFTFSICN